MTREDRRRCVRAIGPVARRLVDETYDSLQHCGYRMQKIRIGTMPMRDTGCQRL
jgi:hypothetical protein